MTGVAGRRRPGSRRLCRNEGRIGGRAERRTAAGRLRRVAPGPAVLLGRRGSGGARNRRRALLAGGVEHCGGLERGSGWRGDTVPSRLAAALFPDPREERVV